MKEYNKGWWDCFISFAGSMKGSWVDETTCDEVMRGAGVTYEELNEVLNEKDELLKCYPKVREMMDVKMMELYAKEIDFD